jgi:pyruvate dehydrogenase E2 component (dihydrolipoamide acetyltransferase)
MAEPVIMPRQGQSVESCIFGEWFVKKGERVTRGELLFSYETDKASFEAEATASGLLLEIFAQPGSEVPVLQAIAVIGEEGEDPEPFRPSGRKSGQPAVTPVAPIPVQDPSVPAAPVPAEITGSMRVSPRARRTAGNMHLDLSAASGSGPLGRVIERDVLAMAVARPRITPLARAIAARDHLRLPGRGTGIGGKILATDVRLMPSITLEEDFEDLKLSNIRKIIARNMYESLANTAQLTLHRSADARRLLALREEFKRKRDQGYPHNITINDLVAFALVRALKVHPEFNTHFLGDSLRKFHNVHLGFAVDTPRGLMVPTLRFANTLSLEELSAKMKDLAGRCQNGNPDPEFLKGGSFTMTNLGAFGIEMFTPVLNPPQIGILGVNAIRPMPADLGPGLLAFVPRIGLSLTFDHRAVDGAPAAAFLREICLQIEKLEPTN